MQKSLIVTLANEEYMSQAKQLFASVYYNAGWKGDYMLMGHRLSQQSVQWCKDRGIRVWEVSEHYKKFKQKELALSAVTLGKCELLRMEFTQWDHVVYIDTDVIVRSPLDDLLSLQKFSAVSSLYRGSLSGQFLHPSTTAFSKEQMLAYGDLSRTYDLSMSAFNSGFFVLPTAQITSSSYDQIMALTDKYYSVSRGSEQPFFNLFFHKNWKEISPIYNLMTRQFVFGSKYKKGFVPPAIVYHFPAAEKPWDKRHAFYREWRSNREKAEYIVNTVARHVSVKRWSYGKKVLWSLYAHVFIRIRSSIEWCLRKSAILK